MAKQWKGYVCLKRDKYVSYLMTMNALNNNPLQNVYMCVLMCKMYRSKYVFIPHKCSANCYQTTRYYNTSFY